MKILVLCPMISSSSFITAYPFVKILTEHHEVKIVGPLLGKDPYIKDNKLEFDFVEPPIKKPIQLAFIELYRKNKSYVKKQKFDVIHCFKLLPHTAPIGSFAKKKLGKKFVLSIDDYDISSPKNPIKRKILEWAEKSYRDADAITVSSKSLRNIYGGEIIYQVANEAVFINNNTNVDKFKKKHGVFDEKIIAYAGTLFDFKGIDILIKAVQNLKRNDVKLIIAGEPTKPYRRLAGKETIFTGKIPMEEVVNLTAASDIYVIPTKDTLYSRAEIPAKIFEPMMMGKSIIASRLSDLPEILDNGKCGVLIKPGDVYSLGKTINYLLNRPAKRKELGLRAKNRYLKNYSYSNIRKKINALYSKLAI